MFLPVQIADLEGPQDGALQKAFLNSTP